MSSTGVTLDAVVERFAESQQALQQAAEKLHSIALAEDGAQSAARSVESATGVLRDLASRLAESADGLSQAQAQARELLERSRTILESTELASLNDDLSGLRTELTAGFDRVIAQAERDEQWRQERAGQDRNEIFAGLDRLSGLAEQLEQERAARVDAERRLAEAFGSMSGRQRKRIGE